MVTGRNRYDPHRKKAKVIRIFTTAPLMAWPLCALLYHLTSHAFASFYHYLAAVFFLTILPLLAYPTAALVPAFRRRGRTAQRNLALLFSVIGYLGGSAVALWGGGTSVQRVLFGTYLLSGVTLAISTVSGYKASGHTCGCSGPLLLLSTFVSPWFLLGYLLLIPIILSSLQLKRHTLSQLLIGALVPVPALWLCCAVFLSV